ncbi:MAG: DedA family protein [Nocardioidaceae bacterium]
MLGAQSLPLAAVAAFGFAFVESGLGLGVLVPGETAVVAIAAAVDGPVATLVVFCAVACGACAGDHVGYMVGRTQGLRVRRSRAVARLGAERWDRATVMLRRHGALAVFATRLLPVVRTLTPAAAGCSGVGYAKFAAASLSGSMLWSALYVGGASVAITTLRATYDRLGTSTWWLLAVVGVVVGALTVLRWRRSTPRPQLTRAGTASIERPRPGAPVPPRPPRILASSARSPD